MPAKKEESKKKPGTQNTTQNTTQTTLKSQGDRPGYVMKSKKAGLLFPVSRVMRLMKKRRYADRISVNSAIGVSAVLEYLTAEILEMAGDKVLGSNSESKSMIKPRHICLAVKDDEEMSRAIGHHVIIPMGGVIPHIEEALVTEKPNSRSTNSAVDSMKDDQAEISGDEDEDEEEDNSTNENDESSIENDE
jgi:histone H2A